MSKEIPHCSDFINCAVPEEIYRHWCTWEISASSGYPCYTEVQVFDWDSCFPDVFAEVITLTGLSLCLAKHTNVSMETSLNIFVSARQRVVFLKISFYGTSYVYSVVDIQCEFELLC